ncbi:MAG: hypothetical protein ACI9GZ_003197 [Bacteroidia bacterium]|jgi:hypothetical protein
MEKSIESIWKKGFLETDALIAPKLNDLYNQKSKNTVDKLMRMGKKNLILIMVGASIILLISLASGVGYAGTIIFLLLSAVVYYGIKQNKKVKDINKALSSYQYLRTVDSWLKETISGYTKMCRFFYPAFLLTFTFGLWFSNYNEEMLKEINERSPDLNVIFGIPVIFVVALFLMAGLSSIFAGTIYKFDLKIVYGRVFNKIDELIADMEELRT